MAHIRSLAASLDAHRHRQQLQHPTLTLTGMYNVLEKIRTGEALNAQERVWHEQGLVSVMRQIHDDLDAAVLAAYGWPVALTDEEILERLVQLNAERATEERRGIIRWLRPEFQHPDGSVQTHASLEEQGTTGVERLQVQKPKWPVTLAEQAQAIRSALVALAAPATPEDVARYFTRARVDRVTDLLETLVSLGQARQLDDGKFAA
jgi:hypothetical protein